MPERLNIFEAQSYREAVSFMLENRKIIRRLKCAGGGHLSLVLGSYEYARLINGFGDG